MKLALFIAVLLLLVLARPAHCAQGPAAYNFVDRVTSSGVQRTFHVHVPATYNRARSMPLVLVFHGLGMNGQSMIYLTNFNSAADKNNFVAVYPDALGRRWGGGDDVHFVEDMINRLSTIINIDQRHIYAAGISNGGQFVQTLACASNRIAAIGVVASSLSQNVAAGCGGNRMPVVFFIGTSDPLVPSTDAEHNEQLGKLGELVGLGGLDSLSAPMARMGGMLTAEETVDFWCQHNRCSNSSPYTVQMPDKDPRDGTRVSRISYGSNDVVYYRIQGGGHSWPGAFYSGPSDVVGRCSEDINATELLTDFFLRH